MMNLDHMIFAVWEILEWDGQVANLKSVNDINPITKWLTKSKNNLKYSVSKKTF